MWSFYCSGTLDQSVFLGILVASLRAVGCAATLATAGLWLARHGLMTPSLSKGLSQLSVKVAIPALLFSSMVPGISFEMLSYSWPLLLLPAVYLLLGLMIGGLMLVIVRPPENFRLSTVAACTFGNTTGIPVVLLSVLQRSLSRSVFADIADPLLFLSIELLSFPILQVASARAPTATAVTCHLSASRPVLACAPQWLVGLALLRFASDRGRAELGGGRGGLCGNVCSSLGGCCSFCGCTTCGRLCGAPDEDDVDDVETTIASLQSSEAMLLNRPMSEGRAMQRHRGTVAEESTGYISMMSQGEDAASPFDSLDHSGASTLFGSVSDRLHALSFDDMWSGVRKSALGCWRGVGKLVRRTFVPQVVGILSGGAVGLFGRQLVLPPETAPLGWLFIGISKLGAAAVPINLILLGAALSRTPERGQLPPLTVAGIIVGRMVFMPLLGLVVAKALHNYNYISIPYIVADPFWLVCLILTATPTANNIVVMSELAGENRRAMSAAIFYQYCAAPILLPGVLTLFIAFICRTRRQDEA